jgi:hypothetical protein
MPAICFQIQNQFHIKSTHHMAMSHSTKPLGGVGGWGGPQGMRYKQGFSMNNFNDLCYSLISH